MAELGLLAMMVVGAGIVLHFALLARISWWLQRNLDQARQTNGLLARAEARDVARWEQGR